MQGILEGYGGPAARSEMVIEGNEVRLSDARPNSTSCAIAHSRRRAFLVQFEFEVNIAFTFFSTMLFSFRNIYNQEV